jgi:hypothetical protein
MGPAAGTGSTRALAGDIVFLGSDGIADNFNAVLLKQARALHDAVEV